MPLTHVLTEQQLECLRGCSGYEQYYQGRTDFEQGTSALRPPYHEDNTVLYNDNGWVGWEVPQKFTTRQQTLALQFLFFPERPNLRRPAQLTRSEQLGFFQVIQWMDKRYSPPGGGIIMRYGDMCYNVGTIMDLHATNMVPNRQGSVIIPLQKDDKMWKEHNHRMEAFAGRYEAGERP